MAIGTSIWRYDWVLDFDIHGFSIDWTVEKRWEGDDAHAQGQHGKDKADPGAESDHFQPCGVSKTVVMNCVKD